MSFNRHTEEELFLIRPRFKLHTTLKKEDILTKIRTQISPQNHVEGNRVKNRCFLRIPPNEQHYWSPEMQVEVIENNENLDYVLDKSNIKSTTIRCVVGPKPKIWTMFMFGYGVAAIIIFFGGMYGLVQYNLGNASPFLWSFPIGLAIIVFLYTAAAFGRKKGRDQMLHLISFLYHSIDDNEIVRE